MYPRTILAYSDVHLISLDTNVLREHCADAIEELAEIARTMATRQWLLFSMNREFTRLSLTQKLDLHSIIQGPLAFQKGAYVLHLPFLDGNGTDNRRVGKKMDRAYIVIEGEVKFDYDSSWGDENLVTFRETHEQESFSGTLGPGSFIGDVQGLGGEGVTGVVRW